MFNKYILPAIGFGAFVIGGIIAREKSLEVVRMVEDAFSDSDAS